MGPFYALSSRIEVVSRPDGSVGFVKLPRRWVEERTFAWLGRYRRNSRDYERFSESSEAMIKVSSIHRMLGLLKWVQPVWLQPSRDRKPLRYREEVLARRIGPGSEVRPRGHYSQSRLKGEAQGTYPDRCSTSPKRERSGVGPHERRSE